MITLRFVTCRDLVSAAVRAYQYEFWASHIDALVEGKLIGAHYRGGVQARLPGYDSAIMIREELVSIPATEAVTKAFEQFVTEQIGKRYDYRAIAALVTNRNWHTPNAWFCSEMLAAAMESCGLVRRFPTTINRILPRDVRMIVAAIS